MRRFYAVPGDDVLGLFAALQASPIDLICSAGEEGVGFAADAHGSLQGLGVAVVTYGLDALKLLDPVAGAYAKCSPLLVISGVPGLRESEEQSLLHHRIRADQLQLRLFREITVASAVLDSGRDAVQELVRVLEAIRHEGERWLAWLRGRLSPLVLGGVELARFGLQPLLWQILEREGWALATSLSGKTLLSESHPQVLGIDEGAGLPESRSPEHEGLRFGCLPKGFSKA